MILLTDNETGFRDSGKMTGETVYRPAGVSTRLGAYLIDLIVVFALTNLFIPGALGNGKTSGNLAFWGVGASAFGVLASLYFLLMTGLSGQTIGKMILGIKVIGIDGSPPGWSSLFFREVIGRFISQAAGIQLGYIWAVFNIHKQGWHDFLGDTYVIIEPEIQEKRDIVIRKEYFPGNRRS